jgi:hypothetical protein
MHSADDDDFIQCSQREGHGDGEDMHRLGCNDNISKYGLRYDADKDDIKYKLNIIRSLHNTHCGVHMIVNHKTFTVEPWFIVVVPQFTLIPVNTITQ